MTGGIYKISDPSDKCYIGSTVNFGKRKKEHIAALRLNKHHSRYLQRAWNKHGESYFEFSTVLVCEDSDLYFFEQLLLDHLKPVYNASPSAIGTRGLKWTEEQKLRHRGRVLTEDNKASISAGMLENTTFEQRSAQSRKARLAWTDESKKKQKVSLTGRKHSAATILKMSATHLGHSTSEETKAKISAAQKGIPRPAAAAKQRGRKLSPEHCLAMSLSRKGKPGLRLGAVIPQTMRDQISAKLVGRKRSPEAIAKHRATCAAKRASKS